MKDFKNTFSLLLEREGELQKKLEAIKLAQIALAIDPKHWALYDIESVEFKATIHESWVGQVTTSACAQTIEKSIEAVIALWNSKKFVGAPDGIYLSLVINKQISVELCLADIPAGVCKKNRERGFRIKERV